MNRQASLQIIMLLDPLNNVTAMHNLSKPGFAETSDK